MTVGVSLNSSKQTFKGLGGREWGLFANSSKDKRPAGLACEAGLVLGSR